MKVFLSWSGERSRLVATALHEWLPQVINAVEPFLSTNIDAGARWQSDVAAELESTDFGIVCVTADNQGTAWLNFEAGALAKKVGAGRVVPLAIDLSPAEILLPLAQFQAQPLSEAGMRKIVSTINSCLSTLLPKDRVEKAIKMWWPELESELQQINHQLSQGVIDVPVRTNRELLEDILDTVRSLARGPALSGRPRGYIIFGDKNQLLDASFEEALDTLGEHPRQSAWWKRYPSSEQSPEPDKSSDD
ncbi:MAG: toll/interleukin-1 receptor domain-containing protein [Acidobacteria bacterium]|nr:toll/interleukin-1 receptor domain-containing protein [Acidobacteriota bacterium]